MTSIFNWKQLVFDAVRRLHMHCDLDMPDESVCHAVTRFFGVSAYEGEMLCLSAGIDSSKKISECRKTGTDQDEFEVFEVPVKVIAQFGNPVNGKTEKEEFLRLEQNGQDDDRIMLLAHIVANRIGGTPASISYSEGSLVVDVVSK